MAIPVALLCMLQPAVKLDLKQMELLSGERTQNDGWWRYASMFTLSFQQVNPATLAELAFR